MHNQDHYTRTTIKGYRSIGQCKILDEVRKVLFQKCNNLRQLQSMRPNDARASPQQSHERSIQTWKNAVVRSISLFAFFKIEL